MPTEARAWLVGWSDTSTLLRPLTTITGLATLHGTKLMDEPLDHAGDTPTRWRSLDGTAEVEMRGRLIGGCLETAEPNAITVLRMLTSLRLAGWFGHANRILIGRTGGADVPELHHDDAVRP